MRFKHMSLPLVALAFSSLVPLVGFGQSKEDLEPLSTTRSVASCGVALACDAAPPVGTKTGFLTSSPSGSTFHFGKDFYLNETEDQWVIGKFQYGNFLVRSPLVHEEVVIQVLRDCGANWETLGSTMTTAKGEHPEVLSVQDEGGMVFFKIPAAERLGLGRHRLRLQVSGDQSATELFLEILPEGTTLFVSDVDGTLTTSELIEGFSSIIGATPPAHPGAAQLLTGLAKKGYHPLYLTARATSLIGRTREFIKNKKFPAGIIQTSSASIFGISGDKAVAYKTGVLQGLQDRGFRLAYGFGNTKVDAGAFANVDIPDSNKFFFKFPKYSDYGGGQSFDNYENLQTVKDADDLCQ